MRPVVISVELPPPHGGVVEHRFTTSPIQLGRNPKADLRLPYDFVSSWHALIRFDETSASYFDLGSTNGTEVDGRRIGPGEVLEFDGPVRVRIADLALTLSRGGAPAWSPGPPPSIDQPFVSGSMVVPSSAPPEYGYAPPERGSVPPERGYGPSSVPPERGYGPSSVPPERGYEPPPDLGYMMGGGMGGGMDIGAPVPPPLMPMPGGHTVGPAPRSNTQMLTPRRSSGPSTGDSGLALVRELSQRLLPNVPPPQTLDEARGLLDRVATLVETCARGVVEMQAGQERMGQELGIQTVKHYTGLRFAATASAAIEYLLADSGTGDHLRRLDELAVGFADSMSHQVAMLDGLVAGARALVDALEPRAVEQEVAGRLGRLKDKWAAYGATWQRLAADDRKLVKALFGPEFARVYAEVGGELSAAWRRNEGSDARDDGEGSNRAP
jgi:predicted component of type VI protein secretion system